ncbi:hypothetical protein N7478_003430 [Penicillium angulare]|uniref:uncharacterized protein n=1 Tax=Penicillium angulare TaxID=116970 RepID=UPI0025412204|nr:uncharacterized protein N7478_003430 [Penicillium angulare]KAJ5287744.1 hypothetical protein N7478_003430 [Penicillium angulare]
MAENFNNLPLLNEAIDESSEEVLASMLKEICQKYPSITEFVQSRLLVCEDEVARPGTSATPTSVHEGGNSSNDEGEDTTSATASRSGKLKKRYARCENCEEEFDVTGNTVTSCSYHPSESEPNYEEFLDHDEDCHGIIDSDEMREDYPEKFYFVCCDRRYNEKGCVIDWHLETDNDSGVWKRRKF